MDKDRTIRKLKREIKELKLENQALSYEIMESDER